MITRGSIRGADCKTCPLAVDGEAKRPVVAIGPKNPRLIVLGEGPGGQEVRQLEPFVGPSGQLVTSALSTAQVERKEVWITNTTLCLPSRDKKEEEVQTAARCCRPRLNRELKRFPHVPLLALGKHAAHALINNKFKITEIAGTYHVIDGRAVIPTIHPAAILRNQDGGGEEDGGAHTSDLLYTSFVYDVNKTAALARGELEEFSEDIELEYEDAARAHQLVVKVVKAAKAKRYVAIDTETKGLSLDCDVCPRPHEWIHDARDAYYAKLIVIGLAVPAFGISVLWEILQPKTKRLIKKFLADVTIAKDFHNELYDKVVLERNGYPVRGKTHCTLIGHHNAFPGLNHKLQRVVTQFLLIPPWKAEFRNSERESVEDLLRYNSLDTLTLARIRPSINICIKKTRAEETYALDLKMAEVAMRMQFWGIPIDRERNQILAQHFTPIVEKSKKKLAARLESLELRERFFDLMALEKAKKIRKADPEDFEERHAIRLEEIQEDFEFNPNARDQIAALLVASGVPLFQVTKTGSISTKKGILETWGAYDVVKELQAFRNAEKLLSTFVVPFGKEVDKHGRVHVRWSVTKITGRWGSKRAAQNWSKGFVDWPDGVKKTWANWLALPRKKRGIPNLRWQVVAPRGRIFVGGDFKQLEARVIGLRSGDPYLVHCFVNNIDIHTEFARAIFADFDDLSESMRVLVRDHVKRSEYGYLYGASPQRVWAELIKDGHNIPFKKVLEMYEVFRKRMPYVEKWHASLFEQVLKEGCIYAMLLRRRRDFPLGTAEATVVKNFTVQAEAANIMNMGLSRFWDGMNQFNDLKLLIQGHDALVVECDEDEASVVADYMRETLTQEHTLSGVTMKFPVDVKIGPDWGMV